LCETLRASFFTPPAGGRVVGDTDTANLTASTCSVCQRSVNRRALSCGSHPHSMQLFAPRRIEAPVWVSNMPAAIYLLSILPENIDMLRTRLLISIIGSCSRDARSINTSVRSWFGRCRVSVRTRPLSAAPLLAPSARLGKHSLHHPQWSRPVIGCGATTTPLVSSVCLLTFSSEVGATAGLTQDV
jgi:hypothetical protein